MKPQPGDPAPTFTAPVVGKGFDDSQTLTLSDLLGCFVVLVFYPKDGTPGCTRQACELRDGWDSLPKSAKVFGVSVDDISSHGRFLSKHSLPYPLISDPEKEIVARYGVWVGKSMYGRKFMGTERTTFVIDPQGTIAAVLEKVTPSGHLGLLKQALLEAGCR